MQQQTAATMKRMTKMKTRAEKDKKVKDLHRMNQLSTCDTVRDPDLCPILSDVTLTMRVARATRTNYSDNIQTLL